MDIKDESQETPQEMFDRMKKERKEREAREKPVEEKKYIFWITFVSIAIIGLLVIAIASSKKEPQKEYGLVKSVTQTIKK